MFEADRTLDRIIETKYSTCWADDRASPRGGVPAAADSRSPTMRLMPFLSMAMLNIINVTRARTCNARNLIEIETPPFFRDGLSANITIVVLRIGLVRRNHEFVARQRQYSH